MGIGAAIGGIAAGAGSVIAASQADGGGGGGGGYSKKSSSPYTAEQRALLDTMVTRLQSEMGKRTEPPPDTVPEPTMPQEQVGKYAESFFSPGPYGTSLLQQQQERAMGLMEPEEWDPSQSRQRWREAVMEPAYQQWEQETAPQLMEEYASRNALSSSGMSQALAESRGNIAKKGMAELADLTFQDYQQQRQRNLQRAQLGQTMLGQTLQQAQQVAGVSDIPRSIEQQEMEEARQQELYGRAYNNPWLQSYYGPTMGVQPNQTSYISKPPSAESQMLRQLGPMAGKAIGRGIGGLMQGGGAPNYGTSPGTASYNPPMLGGAGGGYSGGGSSFSYGSYPSGFGPGAG